MMLEMTNRLRRCSAGFNLIEVTLAVAVVAVALSTVLALLPSGMQASRQVSDDTIITTIVGDMFHWRRVIPFDQPTVFPYNAELIAPRPREWVEYFDANGYLPGTEYEASPGINYADWRYTGPYFKFTYRVQDHPDFAAVPDVAQVVVTVEWPNYVTIVGTTTNINLSSNAKRRVFVSNFARMK
jgi:prepilin-type N-terminal cleavage/methylation domain-containing protein